MSSVQKIGAARPRVRVSRSGWIGLAAIAVCTALAQSAFACPVTPLGQSLHRAMSALPARHDEAVPCVNGVAAGYPCNNIDLLSFTPLSAIGGGEGNDIWGWTDALTGREYAIMGRSNGTAFIDITHADHPVYLGNLPTHTTNSTWRDIKTYNSHAFIVSEAANHGMQVFDLRQLRNVTDPPQTFQETTHYDDFGSAHNIAINPASGFAYALGTRNADDSCNGGLHMINIADVTNPTFAGCYSEDGYTHDAQCVNYIGPDADYNNGTGSREICFNYNEDTLTIVDVTDKSDPELIARRTYQGSGYTHQGWINEEQTLLLLDDELDESRNGHNTRTYIWNIDNLDSPRLSMTYDAPTTSIDHNLYIKDGFAFQANYRSGLRILDLSNIDSGVVSENGFFDVFPGSDSASFNGAWSVYPYFESGNIVVSGIEQGLFVLWPTALEAPFTLASSTSNLDFCGNGSGSAPVTLAGRPGFDNAVSFSVSGAPAGMTVQVTPQAIVPPANVTLSIDVAGVVSGVYPLTVTASDGLDDFSISVDVSVSADLPGTAGLVTPLSGSTGLSVFQPFFWSAAADAFRYDVDVATDAAFESIVASASNVEAQSFTPVSALATESTYFWRVRSRNACGTSQTATASFTTAAESCRVFAADDVPFNILSGGTPTVISTLQTDLEGLVTDVNVIDVSGLHTYVGDLQFRLEGPVNEGHSEGETGASRRHPTRTTVTLMNRICGADDNFDLNFDDEASTPIPCPPTGGGTHLPTAALAEFNGVTGTGDWRLYVSDNFPSDGGRLDAWGLELCSVPAIIGTDGDQDGLDNDQDNCATVPNADQRDTDSDGFGNACDTDLNNDGTTNFVDLGQLRQVFFTDDANADFNGDGVVNVLDLGIMRQRFFQPPGPSGLAN
ncbi:MAG: choice-of-anchor B family protein [Pseudomonadota bacterium]